MTLDRHRTEIDGIEIAWLGATPASPAAGGPVVVLHGLGSSSREFTYLADIPGLDTRPWFLVDAPGFGDSDAPEGWSYGMEAQADLLAALIQQVAAVPVTLLGHSMGGSIAIALAHRHPGLVARLVVAEPNLDPGAGTSAGTSPARPRRVSSPAATSGCSTRPAARPPAATASPAGSSSRWSRHRR